jgi:ribonuclease J
VDEYPPEKVVLLVTGSQGEPMAALSRVVFDQSKYVSIEEGDRILVSARIIPGNEKRVGRILNQVYRKGGEVVTVEEDRIHVSGHAYQEEIKLLATWLRPRYYVPVHGEYRQLMGNAALARQVGMDRDHILMCEDGDTLCFEDGIFKNREQVPVGSQLIDGDSRDPVDRVVVRDRRYLSSGGVVVPVVVINRQAGVMEGDPEIISRGYSFLETDAAAAEEVKADIRAMIGALEREEIRDATILKAKLKSRVKKTLKRNEQGIPLIIPVVMEI